MKKAILSAIVLAIATQAQARFTSRSELTIGTAQELQGNTIYDVSADLTLSASEGTSKFRVLGNNVVAINIRKDVTLTLTGGNATGTTGAGAAIEVTPGATLYLMGEGKLVVTGGAAANGIAGLTGGNGSVNISDSNGIGGSGGTGGAGGGGGAAAIGGVGGSGGAGGGGGSGTQKPCVRSDFAGEGGSGSPGSKGTNGGGMGRVVILGNLTVEATAGAAATADGSAGSSGGKGTDKGSGWTNNYAAGGGGGGGGGARGQEAEYGIGGGGAGGAGGGGGGAGGTLCNSATGYETAWGAGGKGGKAYNGKSGSTGNSGGDQTKTLYYGTAKGGGGGEGGAANMTRGDNGTLMIGPSVQFTSSPRRASNTPLAPAMSGLYSTILHFYSKDLATSQNVEVGTATASLMLSMPPSPDVTRNGYRFLGYFTEESGGVCIYGPDGAPSSPVWETADDTLNLYAHWEVAPTMFVVNTNEDGENLGQGKITLRDAMRELCADAALAGTGGLRRIEFDLPADDDGNFITLTRVIAVDAGTSPIAIDGFNGGKGVTITSGGEFSALQLTGSDVSLSCLNFRNCQGPAVVHSGGLTVADCSFIGNKGAIRSGRDAKLAAMNCTFADNTVAGGGGAVAMADSSADAAFVNCTFARNKASNGSAVHSAKAPLVFIHCTLVPGGANALVSAPGIDTYFLNTLIAKPAGGTAVTAGTTTSICSSLGTQAQGDILNPAQADDLLGVRQIWYEPVQSSASGNRDAATVLYDYNLANVAIVTNGVTDLLYGLNAGLATMPLGIDQLHAARMAPVRGSIRIATGVQPPVVNIEGVAWGFTNATVSATATVLYDDGTSAQGIPLTLKTNGDAVFGAAVEVDGSDLYTHNATEVRLNGLPGDPSMTVATSPYALVASSATVLATEDSEVNLPGDEIRVTTALADSLVVNNLTVGGKAFSAGSLAGFQDITLDDVNVRGGSLRLFGSNSKDGGAQMANLDNKTIGGGEGGGSGSLKDGSQTWTAQYDGFVQVRVEASDVSKGKVGLTVGSVTVTPLAAIGTSGSRTPVWTVPVRKGEKVTLEARGINIGYTTQFIYFGVKE